MKKQLEEIERNMRSILEKINDIGFEYRNIEVSLWPPHSRQFFLQLWDGNNHPKNGIGSFDFTIQEFIDWVERKKILFQKFDLEL